MDLKEHILIVDDVADNIQVAMNILHEDNYAFSFASSGSKALALLNDKQADSYDLILLDIMMPGMDGFEVCRQLKASSRWKDVPIIFLTARADIESITTGYEVGGVDYVTKPFHAAELLARVKSNLELYQAKKTLKQQNISLAIKGKLEQKRLLSELEENQKELIWMLTELMEATSDETGKHVRRVAEVSSLLAKYHPSLTDTDADILFHASPMHDIGKITIPHEILHKPSRYTEEEFLIMQAHTSNAYQLLSRSKRKYVKAAAVIAHQHHEKWNGKGYPRQLKGDDIHIYGRIVALADVFDALSHGRCYKKLWEFDEVVTYIQEHSGTQFDPQLVDIFMAHLDEFLAIAKTE